MKEKTERETRDNRWIAISGLLFVAAWVVGLLMASPPAATTPMADLIAYYEANRGMVMLQAYLLAVPGNVVEEVIATYAHLLDHKIILDAANKYRNGSNRNYAAHNPHWNEPELNSLSFIQTHAPHAHAYRAFNSYSIHPFADPIYQGVQADLFYCGPVGSEKAIVEQLIAEVGLRPIYLGESAMVEVVDGVIRLWAALAFFQDRGVNNVAFKVLTR